MSHFGLSSNRGPDIQHIYTHTHGVAALAWYAQSWQGTLFKTSGSQLRVYIELGRESARLGNPSGHSSSWAPCASMLLLLNQDSGLAIELS